MMARPTLRSILLALAVPIILAGAPRTSPADDCIVPPTGCAWDKERFSLWCREEPTYCSPFSWKFKYGRVEKRYVCPATQSYGVCCMAWYRVGSDCCLGAQSEPPCPNYFS